MTTTGVSLLDFTAHLDQYHTLRLRLNHQPSSVLAAQRDLNLLGRYCQEHDVPIINGSTVLDFFSYLHDDRDNGSGAINRKRASICTYLRNLRARQVPGANEFPLECLPRARQAYAGPVKVLEPDEVARLLNSIPRSSVLGYRDFTLFSLQYAIGLRLGEALKIDIADIDFQKKVLLVHGKGRKERTLPLAKPVLNMLSQWLKHRKELLNSETLTALFISKKGNRLSMRTAEDNFQKLVKRDGEFVMPHPVPHTLRHCFASHFLETEKDIVILKAMLGHALMRSTEIYLHPSMDLLSKSAGNHIAAELISNIRAERTWIRGVQKTSGG